MPTYTYLQNFRPTAVVIESAVGMRQEVTLIPEAPADPPPPPRQRHDPLKWFKGLLRPSEPRHKKPLSMVFPTEGIAQKIGGLSQTPSIQSLTSGQFADYCELIRILSREAVPRFHGYGAIPEREAFVEDFPAPHASLQMLHARIIWTGQEQIAMAYSTGFGGSFQPWAERFHSQTNFPAACRALTNDVMVVIPKFWVMSPALRHALYDSRGKRYPRSN
jgi:hypothetical protein